MGYKYTLHTLRVHMLLQSAMYSERYSYVRKIHILLLSLTLIIETLYMKRSIFASTTISLILSMKHDKYLYLVILFLLYLVESKAQEISFSHLTPQDGLSHNSVTSIYQDEKGIMWFGTRSGACQYNGNKFTIYKSERNNPNSILHNSIKKITGDQNGKIFFMTSQGISEFSIHKNQFTTLIQENTNAMYYHKQLYISRENNVYRYENGRFTLFYTFEDSHITITCLYICDEYSLIGTEKHGVFRLDNSLKLAHIIPQGNITNIFKDSTGKVWFGTWNSGAYLLDGTSLTNFRHTETDPTSISSNFVRSFCEDKQGNIWLGTFNSLDRFNTASNTFTHFQKQETKNSLSHSSIWSLLCDQQGTIWAGTYFGGVNFFNPESQIFRHFQVSRTKDKGLSGEIVSCITEDSQHNLWICTEGGGITKYNPANNTFKWYRHDKNNPNSLSHDNIKSIYYDRSTETMWIGTHLGGLNKLTIHSNQFTHYRTEPNKVAPFSDIIREIIPYKDKLVLTTHEGLYLFDPASGKSIPLFQDAPHKINTPTTTCIDHKNQLWFNGNGYGVYNYNIITKEIKNYRHNHALPNSISYDNVHRIYEDSQQRLWLCTTENGVDLYRHETDDFENFNEQQNGLGSNCVYDVCELSPNKILVTTISGFSILDFPSRKFSNYNKENGLPLSAINERSVYKATDGNIYIGGIDGMISFKEETIDYTPQNYHIYPFKMYVNGEEVMVDDETGILDSSLVTCSQITLKHSQSMFNIEYAISNYIPYNKDELEYYLEGFSKKWTNMNGQYNITYTNLNPGKYTLIVRTKSNQNIPVSKLNIEILPPFYLTSWAYLLYTLCIASILYFVIKAYKNRIKLQESLRYEKKHAEDIEQLNQTKLRFFTNISHEFRTPLTLIIGQMEMLLQVPSFPPSVYNRILGVYKSGLQMRELVTELLDFRKQEQGYMTIKVNEHNIVDFVYENYLLFQEYALRRQITFNFYKTHDHIQVWYDSKQLQKVMNNLISNAFKHTKEGGTISVSVRKGNKEVIIEVSDNGSGIAPKDIEHIFNRFYQTEQTNSPSYTGTGIGLSLTKGIIELHHGKIEVYSTPGEETTFTVHLLAGKEHFASEQICEMKDEVQISVEEAMSQEITHILPGEQEVLSSESFAGKKQEAKILLVEDNESLREMLTGLFSTFYTVITACDGEEGWEKVQSEHPNIVLSDVVMPRRSGTELCKLMKENIETCHIPVVLLTARTAIEYNLEGLRLGADDYITKPFNINILLSRCNNLVNNRIMLQEKFSKQPLATPQILATNPMDKELVDKAMIAIEKHIDNAEFNVDILAREVGIARTKLFNKLKDITGQTPYDFIITIRLKRAAIMLKEHPEFNVSEIADKLGFSSPRQFSKSFKEKYHITPQAYKKGENSDGNNQVEEEEEDI